MSTETTFDIAGALRTFLAELPPPAVAPRSARASEAGACTRAVWYRAHDIPRSEALSLRGYLAMRIGTHLGADLAAAVGGAKASSEMYWQLDGLSGHADLVLQGESSHDTVFEFKSMDPFSWKYYDRPRYEHSLQLQLNALGLCETEQICPMPDLFLVYLNTTPRADDEAVEVYKLEYDSRFAQRERVRLIAAARAHTLAPRDFDPDNGDWQCRYCSWLSRCEDEAEADDVEREADAQERMERHFTPAVAAELRSPVRHPLRPGELEE